jgi:hypothetical protein
MVLKMKKTTSNAMEHAWCGRSVSKSVSHRPRGLWHEGNILLACLMAPLSAGIPPHTLAAAANAVVVCTALVFPHQHQLTPAMVVPSGPPKQMHE